MEYKKKELVKNTFIISIGKFSTQLISFLLLPFYTSYLNTSDFGLVDLMITYSTLFLPCITFGIESAGFRFLIDYSDDDNSKNKIVSNVFICNVFSIIMFLFLYLLLRLFVNIPFYYCLLAYSISVILSNSLLDITRGFGDNVSYSIANLIIGGCTIVFNVLFLTIFSYGPISIFLSSTISNIFGCVFLLFRNKIFSKINLKLFSSNLIKKFLKYSLPLIPNAIIWWIISVSDRTIISYMLGTEANGLYAVSNKFSNAIISIYYVFQLSWTESMCRYATDKKNTFFVSNTFNEISKIVFSICISAIVIMPFIFPLLVNASYADSYFYIPILIVSSFFNVISQLTSSLYISFKKTSSLLLTSLIGCVVNVFINIIFISKIGLFAASISTLLSFMLISIIRIIDLKKYITLSANKKNLMIMLPLLLLVIITYYINLSVLNIISLLLSVVILFALNKTLIIKTIKVIENKMSIK